MTPLLSRWIGDADALAHMDYFKVIQATTDYSYVTTRFSDYYLALVGDLFSRLSADDSDPASWARLGNAFSQLAIDGMRSSAITCGISQQDTVLFSAAAYYCGGFPASAYLTAQRLATSEVDDEVALACYDFLARPKANQSNSVRTLHAALREGSSASRDGVLADAVERATVSLTTGPNEWVYSRVLERLIARFNTTNVRKVLPDGDSAFWTPLVASWLDRSPPTWEFFPSQIDAINKGLLFEESTFSLQMPTGSGKTTLCETLLYAHYRAHPQKVAILLVPYRSLASELRGSLVKHLNTIGIRARCAYGGTVPSGSEVQELDDTSVLVATPESLSALLSANEEFFRRISLVICDEGHLLDGIGRGVGLELLLARMKSRPSGQPRFVFISAIIPNIEEINAWLGGTESSVVRSDYRPAIAEFAMLADSGTGASSVIDLVMHPQEQPPTRFTIANFLGASDFQWRNQKTGRLNTYKFSSIKTRSIAAARKALAMGAVAVFSANKRGNQGCIGLAEELLAQLEFDLSLPRPSNSSTQGALGPIVAFLTEEFGPSWIVTSTLAAGAVVHHGDIPQEARELLEALLRRGSVRLAICTSTLAEGVNLPIRTLVLYSVQRAGRDGRREPLLARDIKNLVGRAGRAGANTKGLVVCADSKQWPIVSAVARQEPGEPVKGALRLLMSQLRDALASSNAELTNEALERTPVLHPVVDGIDMTLIDLAAEEIGPTALTEMAIRLADETFASSQATEDSRKLLRSVFSLRASRVSDLKAAGRLGWIKSTGTRLRLLTSVEEKLYPVSLGWAELLNPMDHEFVLSLLKWAWTHNGIQQALRREFRLATGEALEPSQKYVSDIVFAWIAGRRFHQIAEAANLPMDDLLGIYTSIVAFAIQTLLEQGITLLSQILLAQGSELPAAAAEFPEHLRYGAPTRIACLLASSGLRHRHAYVQLGNALTQHGTLATSTAAIRDAAKSSLTSFSNQWKQILGDVVFDNTLADLQ